MNSTGKNEEKGIKVEQVVKEYKYLVYGKMIHQNRYESKEISKRLGVKKVGDLKI